MISTESVYLIIQGLASTDVQQVKQSEIQLEKIKTEQGLCVQLLQILSQPEVQHQAKQASAIVLKQTVTNFWRPRQSQYRCVINSEEKGYIKKNILEIAIGQHIQVLEQLAVAVSKIARYEYPKDWPDLFQNIVGLLDQLQSYQVIGDNQGFMQSQKQANAVLIILRDVLEQFGQMKMPIFTKHYQELSIQLLPTIWIRWLSASQQLGQLTSTKLNDLSQIIYDQWAYLIECIEFMTSQGLEHDKRSLQPVDFVVQMFQKFCELLGQFLESRNYVFNSGYTDLAGQQEKTEFELVYLDWGYDEDISKLFKSELNIAKAKQLIMIDKILAKIFGVMKELQQSHPWSFLNSNILTSVWNYSTQIVLQGSFKLPINHSALYDVMQEIMLLLGGILQCSSYKGVASGVESKFLMGKLGNTGHSGKDLLKQMSSKAQVYLKSLWTNQQSIIQALQIYLKCSQLTRQKLELFQEAGEEFYLEISLTADVDLRNAAVHFMFGLSENYSQIVCSYIQEYFANLMEKVKLEQSKLEFQMVNMDTLHVLFDQVYREQNLYLKQRLHVESLITFLSTAPYDCENYFAFSTIFKQLGFPELQHEPQDILQACNQACTCRMIGNWASVIVDQGLEAECSVVVKVVSYPSLALQMCAVESLVGLLTSHDFNYSVLKPCLVQLPQFLVSIIGQCIQSESFNMLFQLILAMGDAMGKDFKQIALSMVKFIPEIWQKLDGLGKIHVISFLSHLMQQLGKDSMYTYPIIIPILKYCFNQQSSDFQSLVEDSLDLYLAAIKNAPYKNEDLLELLPQIIDILSQNTEFVPKANQIIHSSMILGGEQLVQALGLQIADLTKDWINQVQPRVLVQSVKLLETGLKVAPQQAPALFQTTISILVQQVLQGHFTTILEVGVYDVVNRLLISNTDFFVYQFALRGPDNNQSQQVFFRFFERMLDKFDTIGEVPERKLAALSICQVLELKLSQILNTKLITMVVSCLTQVVSEMKGIDSLNDIYDTINVNAFSLDQDSYPSMDFNNQQHHDSSVIDDDSLDDDEGRQAAFAQKDPVNTAQIKDVISSVIRKCPYTYGQLFVDVYKSIDHTITHQFEEALQ